MALLSYRRHRFPPPIIQHAIWLYLRFTLSYRDVEDLLAERGLDLSYETVRRWVLKFGPVIARRLRRHRPRPSDRWHLDEMAADGLRPIPHSPVPSNPHEVPLQSRDGLPFFIAPPAGGSSHRRSPAAAPFA